MIGGALNNLFSHCKAHVGVFRNAGFVVGDRDHRGLVFCDQGKHALEHLVLPSDRVHQRLALIDRKARFEGFDNG